MLKNKIFNNGIVNAVVARTLSILACVAVAGCAVSTPALQVRDTALYERAVASAIRTREDRDSDASRKPVAFLTFAQVRPGMQVLDVATGGGNTTQLLALVVGAGGKVYAQAATARPILVKRLADNPQSNIVPVVQPFDDPLPGQTATLDLVTINLSYHDIANLPVDRIKMDRRLFDALKPGGKLIVIDHAGRAGTGTTETKTLHRIDEALVRGELEQAGFKLEESGDYLRNPADNREIKSVDMERQTDKFAFRFVKP